MRIKTWLWTFRSLILLLFCAVSIGLLQASDAPDTETVGATTAPAAERTYLYYFESSEAKLDSTTPSAFFAFGTLPEETVTLVAYGLDDIIEPELILTDSDGNKVAEALPTGNRYVVVYHFEASEKRLYHFDVSRKNSDSEATGLVRVMVFEGDPITIDRTLLDNVNPLLPGRSFMVGGKEPTEEQPAGLSMAVEALPIGRFNREQPEIFASRGSDDFMPTLPERIDADSFFQWYNIQTPEIQFYTVTVRATPETLTGIENLKFRQLNADSFFYYDYHLIIGAGSDPVSVVRGDDCQNQPNRIECIARGDESGRSAPAPRLDVPAEAEVVFEEGVPVTEIDVLPPPPPITIIVCDGANNNPLNPLAGTAAGDDMGGTNCNDQIFSFGGNDNVAGGPGNDLLIGGDGDDILRGDEGNDTIYGNAGDDRIDGGDSYDFIHSGTGNDNIGYLTDTGYDHIYYDDLVAGVVVDLSTPVGGGGRDCEAIIGGTAYTGSVVKTGGQVDCLRGQFDVVTTNFDDTVTNNSTQVNYIDTLAGDDTVNVSGSTRVYLGDDNDTVNFSGTIGFATIFDSDSDRITSVTPQNFNAGDEVYNFLNGVTGAVSIGDGGGTDLLNFQAIVGSDTIIDLTGLVNTQVGGLTVEFVYYNTDLAAVTVTEIENVNATNQIDVITTNAVNNIINSYNGDDTIYGSCGIDTLNAGGAADTDLLSYELMGGGVTVSLLTNTATDKAGCGTDTLVGFENLTGSYFLDNLTGSNTANVINALDGNDIVNAGGGNDTVNGGLGDDTLNGDAGDDTINGEDGNDTVDGGAGIDTVNGGIGNDALSGGDDNDTLNGDAGDDTLNGNDGDDILNGDVGIDTLNGGDDDDTLSGGAGADFINGDDGDDTVVVATVVDAIDTIDGGLGNNDVLDASTYTGFFGNGITVNLGTSTYGLGGTVNGIEDVIGSTLNDTITGNASVNNIQTGDGNDTIYASAGNDVIGGGTQTISTAANPGDIVNYAAFNTIMTTTVNGTNAVVTVGGFVQNLTDIENLYGTSAAGTDLVLITGGMVGAGVPLDTDPGVRITTTSASGAAYTFTAAATGRVIVDNSVTDTFTFGTLNGFNPYVLNTYQDLGGGLYLMITRGLNTFCPTTPPGLTIEVDINTTSTHTQCITDETFNGEAGGANEGVSYIARADNDMTVTIGGNVWTVDDGPAVLTGTDTLNDIERLLLNNGDHMIFVTGATLPTNASTVDLGTVAGNHTLDLTGYGANAVVNLTGGAASFGGQLTFLDDITTFIGSNFNDDVTGNGLDNIITTNGGNDFVAAGAGNDTITTGAGSDAAFGEGGDDLFIVITDGVADTYNGGAAFNDVLTYDLASGSVNAIIDGTDQAADGAGFDNWVGFEVVNTGNAADTFTLSQPIGYVTINTFGGADTINVDIIGGALPIVNAGAGDDIFNVVNTGGDSAVAELLGDAGNDTYNITWDAYDGLFDGGADADSVFYQDATALTLLLQVGDDTVTDGALTATDTFTNMESITLGGGIDLVTVNDANGYTLVSGGAGNDTFDINAVNAVTVLDGGAGTGDTANLVDLGAVAVTINGANQLVGVQQLQNFESFVTGDLNDTFNVTTDGIGHTIDANLGLDTANLTSSSGTGVTITVNFIATTVTDNSGLLPADVFRDVENFNGTAQNDTLNFNAINFGFGEIIDVNTNRYDGLGGTDVATYNVTETDLTVTVDAVPGEITVQDTANLAGWTDTFVNFEQVLSGAGNDTWNMTAVTANRTFNAQGETTVTGDLADYTAALAGVNVSINVADITVGQGAFTHTLINFESVLTGAGNDVWTVNNGSGTTGRTFDAAGGMNTMSYNDATIDLAYTANLGAGGNTIVDDDAATPDTDILLNFDILTTDDADDYITIDNSTIVTVNTLDGDDLIQVGSAAGMDNVANNYNMGAGISDDLWLFASPTGLNVGYVAGGSGTVQEGALAIDNFTGVENIAGSNGDDIFTIEADGVANIFYGMAGTDTADYDGATAITATINTFTTTVVGGGTDTLYTFETLIGTDQADTFAIVNAAGSNITSVQGDLGNDIFNITDTGSAAFQMAGGAGADTYNFLIFDGFDNVIAEDGSANVINYSAVGAIDLDVELNAANTTVDDNVNIDTFTGTFATIQTGAGDDEIFVRRALAGGTVQTNAGNDIFHFENDGVNDQIGNGAVLLDAGLGLDTADFATIAGAITGTYTGCAANMTVTSGAQTSILANFESFVGGIAADTFNVAFDACDVTFNGAAGADEINYATTAVGTPLTFTLDGTDTVTDGTNTHSIVSFSIVRGSSDADVFTVVNDGLYTNLYGNGGNDTFNVQSNTAASTYTGDAGQDAYVVDFVTGDNYIVTMTGATGTVDSGTFVDNLVDIEDVTTGAGDDTFILLGDGITNAYDAGAGTDTADYSADVTGLAFVLDGGATETVGNDTLTNFEAMIAGAGADTFTVTGGGEVDYVTLSGNGGDDTFNMEWGATNNILNGGTGVNSYAVEGVTAVDLTVTYASAASSTVVGGGVTDTLNNIANIETSEGDDTFIITADAVNNTFNGGAGAGLDIADYSGNATGLTFNLDGGAFETVVSVGGTDELYDFESIVTTGGDDIINLGTSDYATISANGGDDTFNTTDGAFAADVIINGDAGNNTYTYTGTNPLTVALTNATSTITNSGFDHTLNDVQVVTLNTQAGDASAVTINDTAEVTQLTTGAGNETVTVTDGGTVASLNTGAGADVVTVTDADTMTVINTGTGADTVTLTQDLTNTTVNGGVEAAVIDTFVSNTTGAATTVTQAGTNMTIAAGGNTDVFQNFENGTINTGTGNDIFTIDTDVAGTWVLNSGTGTNRYNFIGSGLGAVSVTVGTGNTTASALDTLDFSGMAAGITVNSGITTVQTVVGTFQLILQTAIANVEGSAFNDSITGTSSNDTINGNAGVDTIFGLAGNDDIDGGAGNDIITGAAGTDTIYGGTGADTIGGGDDDDLLFGGSQSDATCSMGDDAGADNIDGNNGADTIYGGNDNTGAAAGDGCNDTGADDLTGGDGNNATVDGNDTMYGGNLNPAGTVGTDGADASIDGDDGNDTIYGGNNNCGGGTGNDGNDADMDGDDNNDTIYGGNNNCNGGTGNDGADNIDGGANADTVYGGNNNTGAPAGTGTDGNDAITNSEAGGAGNNP